MNHPTFTQNPILRDYSSRLRAIATVSLNPETAKNLARACQEFTENLKGFKSSEINGVELGDSDLILQVTQLFLATSQLCEKVSKKDWISDTDQADLLFKASLSVIQAFILKGMMESNEFNPDFHQSVWRTRLERFHARILRFFIEIEGQREAREVRDQVKARARILQVMQDLEMDSCRRELSAPATRTTSVPLPARLWSSIFYQEHLVIRVGGRRYAVPLSVTRGTGRLEGGGWMRRTVSLGGTSFPLCDLKRVLGFGGEAGHMFVVIASRQGGGVAWAVDGVEPKRSKPEGEIGWFNLRPLETLGKGKYGLKGLVSAILTFETDSWFKASSATNIHLLDTEELFSEGIRLMTGKVKLRGVESVRSKPLS